MSPLRCSWNKLGDGERVDGCIHRLVPSIVLDPVLCQNSALLK